jgi:MFS family permease
MRPIVVITLLMLVVQGVHMGSRVVASLFAIDLGANPFQIGALIAFYSVLPLLLAVYSGVISDRFGSYRPMLLGTAVLGLGLAVPYLWRALPALYLSAVLIGAGFVFFNVSIQNLAGGLGAETERTRNFATLGLGYGGGHMVGPFAAGYIIDHQGFPTAYATFAAAAALTVLVLFLSRGLTVSRKAAPARNTSAFALLKIAPLRRAIILSGLVTTGWDLYTFYVPIYGHSIGLSATAIGTLLAAFAAATLVVRVALPALTSRFSVEGVLGIAMFLGCALFLVFPLVELVPALFALSFCIGLALGCGQPLTVNLAYNRSPPGRSGEVVGLRLFINNITHIGVPLAAGALGAALGVAPVFWVNAAILAASGRLARAGD